MKELCTFERTYPPVRTKLGALQACPRRMLSTRNPAEPAMNEPGLVTISVNELRRVKVVEFGVSAD